MIGTAVAASVVSDGLLPSGSSPFDTFVTRKRAQEIVHKDAQWSLVAGGDVMLSRFVATQIKRNSVDWPFAYVHGLFKSGDIAFVNLENPVVEGPPMPEEGLVFRADPETMIGMENAGIDVVSLANNHQSDVGREYVQTTANAVIAAGMFPIGAGANDTIAHQMQILRIGDTSVAFLAYGDPRFSNQVHFATPDKPGIALADPDLMQRDIALAQKQADVVIVSLHAGVEYREEPDTLQRELLDAAADAGADVVLGHHPHVIQPLWQRNSAWVIASLGNLVFDQDWSEETKIGMVMKTWFSGSDPVQIEAIPVELVNNARPIIATGGARTTSVDRLKIDTKNATTIQWHGVDAEANVHLRSMPLQKQPLAGFTIERSDVGDINHDGVNESFVLRDGRVTVEEDGDFVWASSTHWWVQDFSIADVDGNEHDELILSVWKSGNEGSSKPFWAKENDDSVKNHVFVFTMENDRVLPMWQSSNLTQPNCEIMFADLDTDGVDELVALEGSYRQDGGCLASYVAVWKWNTWGFFNEWRSESGLYWDLRSEESADGTLIIVNGEAE